MERSKNQDCVQDVEAERYRIKIIDIINSINNECVLKKIYTVAITHKSILDEKEGG